MSEYNIQSEEAMSDFIYKNTIVMIHQIIKANYEAGKSMEEILSIIAALTEIPPALQDNVRLSENTHHQNSDGMTDYQFKRYEEYRDRCKALEKELALIQGNGSAQCEQGKTDYQYKHLLELIGKVDTLTHEKDALREENSKLKERLATLEKELEKLRTAENK